MNLDCTDTANCDSVNISYSLNIQPILALNCVGCHSGSSPDGGIALSSYANVKAQVDNGKLIGAVEGKAGYVPMPPGGISLSSCDISQLNLWVSDGAPNN